MKRKQLLLIACLFCFCGVRAQLLEYEYWFDNDFDNRTQGTISGSVADIPELDAKKLSQGLHQWSLRVKKSVSSPEEYPYSGITSGWFYKVPMTGEAKFQYWYNDNFDSPKELPPMPSLNTPINGNINVQDMPFGLNRINFRVAGGPVFQSYVLKTIAGSANRLEYWFDDNFSVRKKINASVYANQFPIVGDADARDLSDGIHRINYRLVSNVTENCPIFTNYFFKGKYSGESIADLSVTQAKFWVNDNKTQPFIVPVTDLTSQDVFKTGMNIDLPIGNYNLNMQILNSAGMWSAVETANFAKMEYQQGNINLTATADIDEENVSLSWNSIKDVHHYLIKRDDAIIKTVTDQSNPATLTATDCTPIGTYKYTVEAYETNSQLISVSNSQTVHVLKPCPNSKFATLLVYVTDPDGNYVPDVDVKIEDLEFHGVDHYSTAANVLQISYPFSSHNLIPWYRGRVSAVCDNYVIQLASGSDYELTQESNTAVVRFLATQINSNSAQNDGGIEMASNLSDNIGYDVDGFFDMYKSTSQFNFTLKNVSGDTWSGRILIRFRNANGNSIGNYLDTDNNLKILEVQDWAPEEALSLGNLLNRQNGEKGFTIDNYSYYLNHFPNGNFTITISTQKKVGNSYYQQIAVKGTDKYLNPVMVPENKENLYVPQSNADIVNEMVEEVFNELKKNKSFFEDLSANTKKLSSVNNFLDETYAIDDPITRGVLSHATEFFDGVVNGLGGIVEAKQAMDDIKAEYKDFFDFINNPNMQIPKYREAGNPQIKDYYLLMQYINNSSGPIGKVFKPMFDVGSAMIGAIDDIEALILESYDLTRFGVDDGGMQYLKIKVDGFKAADIKQQIDRIEIHASANGYRNSTEIAYRIDPLPDSFDNNAASWKITGEESGSPTNVGVKIVFNNGKILWAPINRYTTKEENGNSFVIKLKSEYKLLKHIAEKISIAKP